MRYISDDGKIFNTKQECLEHENYEKKRLEEEKLEKERYEREKKEELELIIKDRKALQDKIASYERKYNVELYDNFYRTDFEKLIHQMMEHYY